MGIYAEENGVARWNMVFNGEPMNAGINLPYDPEKAIAALNECLCGDIYESIIVEQAEFFIMRTSMPGCVLSYKRRNSCMMIYGSIFDQE